MASKSKAKGSGGERRTAAILSAWWQGEPFRRVPNSGALRWGGKAWCYGDLLPPDDCPCVWECKSYADVDLASLLNGDGEKSIIKKWWYEQLLPDQERCEKGTGKRVQAALVFKKDRCQFRLAVSIPFFKAIFGNKADIPHFVYHSPTQNHGFVICSLDAFLAKVDRETFLAAHQNCSK